MRQKRLIYLTIAAIALIIAVGTFILYPGLADRLKGYYLSMLVNVGNRVLPFFLMQISLAAVVLLLECSVVGWQRSSLRQLLHPDKSIVSDVCIFFVNALQIDYVIIFICTFGLLHKLKLGLKVAVGMQEGLLASVSHPVLQLAIYIVVADFMMYCAHYIHHRVPFLWPFHSYHHSANELNVFTGSRGHPVQAQLTNGLIVFIPLTLMGIPLVAFLAFRLVRNTLIFMHHSRLPWRWGWFGRYVIVSPAYHRVHHSTLQEHFDKNLAVLFPIWDHMFGTYYKGSVPVEHTGIPDNLYNRKSFLNDLLVPFRMLWKTPGRH